MGIQLGGPKAWKVRRIHDIGIAFHWIEDEPAMCLFPANAKIALNRGAFVISLDAAVDYVDSNGYPTRYAMDRAAVAAEVMGMDQTKYTLHNILDAMMEGVDDLVKMPPEPDALKQYLGEAQLKIDGRIVHETGIVQ
jgi:hypothetical protein